MRVFKAKETSIYQSIAIKTKIKVGLSRHQDAITSTQTLIANTTQNITNREYSFYILTLGTRSVSNTDYAVCLLSHLKPCNIILYPSLFLFAFFACFSRI